MFHSSRAIFPPASVRILLATRPAHLMSRRIPSLSRNPDSDMEIVEDSEPERVQLRNQSPKSRRLINAGLHTAATVIELSDSESSTSPCGEDAITYGSACNAAKTVKDPWKGSRSSNDLKKFAFKPLPTKQVLLVEPSMPLPPSEARPPKRPAQRKVRMNLDSLLPDVESVSRCVCCSILWTTRKTAAQKLDHIQRCAKKHGYEDETVHILIKNEIISPKESNQNKFPTSYATSTTLLEDIVQPCSNKRKGLKSSNHLSVGSPLREAIRSRAKDIISGPSPDETPPQPSASRKVVSSFPLTQAFTTSTFIQGSSKTSLFSATSQDDDYIPELGNDTISPWTDQPTCHIALGKLPSLSPRTVGDGGCRKGVNQAVQPDQLQPTVPKVPVQKTQKGKLQPAEKDIPTRGRTPLKEDKKVRSTKKKVTFGEEWENYLLARVREDNELNLRIIRYEPLNFSLLLTLAKAYAPSASETTLKPHLRSFLDNQGIHFYEGNVWKR